MRVVMLCSSVYSETACAMALCLAEAGYVPAGALSLSTLNRGTLLRKLGQWGTRGVARYAWSKFFGQGSDGATDLHNPELQSFLQRGNKIFRSMREVGAFCGFPVVVAGDQNSAASIAQLKKWSPDVAIFTGGNILRTELLQLPRLGILNVHLGLLPEIRGMSSPEWSLLKRVPAGVTIHFMDEGIDTGPVLQRYEFGDPVRCATLGDLRSRLIALGVEKIAEVVAGLDRGTIVSAPQSDLDRDHQFFVMHEWLQARAGELLARRPDAPGVEAANG